MRLTSDNVEKVFTQCLTDDEKNGLIVEGVTHNFIFNKDELEKCKENITEMLLDLPSPFLKSVGGGWSFLKACDTKDNTQWTGMHLKMEQLFALGMAVEKVICLMPRELWSVLPGVVPYYMVVDD